MLIILQKNNGHVKLEAGAQPKCQIHLFAQKRDWQEQGYDRGHQNWAQAPGNKRGRFDGVPFRDEARSDRGPQARDAPHFGGPPRFAHPMQKGPPGKHCSSEEI